jgi:hypothetical protein
LEPSNKKGINPARTEPFVDLVHYTEKSPLVRKHTVLDELATMGRLLITAKTVL